MELRAATGLSAQWAIGRVPLPNQPGLLASVATPEEALLVAGLGADIVDMKAPSAGALGAWPLEELRVAVKLLGRGAGPAVATSATIGDLPMVPALLARAAERAADTGVTYVKVGFFSAGGEAAAHGACRDALARVASGGARLVAVLMADQEPDLDRLPAFAAAGIAGIMLDTAGKGSAGLRGCLPLPALVRFVASAREAGLLSGLAGSLGLDDVAPLAALRPDYLGFRTALCASDDRRGPIDAARVSALAQRLASARREAAATAGKQAATAG